MNIPKGDWYASTSPDYFEGGATVVRRIDPMGGLVVAVITKIEGSEPRHTAVLISKSQKMFELLKRWQEAKHQIDIDSVFEDAIELVEEIENEVH